MQCGPRKVQSIWQSRADRGWEGRVKGLRQWNMKCGKFLTHTESHKAEFGVICGLRRKNCYCTLFWKLWGSLQTTTFFVAFRLLSLNSSHSLSEHMRNFRGKRKEYFKLSKECSGIVTCYKYISVNSSELPVLLIRSRRGKNNIISWLLSFSKVILSEEIRRH